MKKVVTVQEVEGEGLLGLLGQRITVWCLNYIYTGDLVGVNEDCVRLDNAQVVYETGDLTSKSWKDAQSVPHPIYVMRACIESFMILK